MVLKPIFRKTSLILGILLFVVTACTAKPASTSAEADSQKASSPVIADSKDFSAQVNSDGQVVLNWKPINGVDGYQIELQIGGDEYVPLASLPANQTTFTDEKVPGDMNLTYRLSAVTKSKTSETKLATVITPAEKINPLKITVAFDQTPAAIDPKTLDPKNFDPSKIDPNNFDPSMFMAQPLQTQAVVGPKGGEITVTGINNVVYTLKIPAESLDFDVSIKLKPISSIPDLPLSKGLIGAVFIEPQEVVFRIPATLTITPPKNTPVPQGSLQAGFAFETNGQEFHLFPTVQNAQANLGAHTARLTNNPSFDETPKDELKVPSGGGYGKGNGTPAEIKAISASNPTNAVDGTTQEVALAQLAIDDLESLPNIPKEATSLAKTGEKISQQANKADDWNKLMETLDKLTTYMNSDGAKYNKSLNEKIISSLLDKANKLLQKSKNDCLSEDDLKAQKLVDQLVNPKDDFSKLLSDNFKNKYGQKLLDELYAGQKACSYEFTLYSNLSTTSKKSVMFANVQTKKFPLFFNYLKGEIYFSGSAPMKLTVTYSGDCSSFPQEEYDKLTFSVGKLSPKFVKGKLKDFELGMIYTNGWEPFKGISSSGDVCPTLVNTRGGGDSWTGLFTIARESLKNQMMKGWILTGGDLSKGVPLTAKWESHVGTFSPLGQNELQMSEDTKLELNITPNKKK
jgi:hypothetical protein